MTEPEKKWPDVATPVCEDCEAGIDESDLVRLHRWCYDGIHEDHLGGGHRACAKLMREVFRRTNGTMVCAWCATPNESEEAMRLHATTCVYHPAVIELTALRAELSGKDGES